MQEIEKLVSQEKLNKKSLKNIVLNIGYIYNINHAEAILSKRQICANQSKQSRAFRGLCHYQGHVYKFYPFNNGNSLISALLAGSVDLAYIGPAPYFNAINQGARLNIIKQVASGGNSFVYDTNEAINLKNFNGENLKNRLKIGVPQLANTQDILAKIYFETKGLDVDYIAVNPAEYEFAFVTDSINVAISTEPWTQLLLNKGFKEYTTKFFQNLINTYPSTILVSRDSQKTSKVEYENLDKYFNKTQEIYLKEAKSQQKNLFSLKDIKCLENNLGQYKVFTNLALDFEASYGKVISKKFICQSIKKINFQNKDLELASLSSFRRTMQRNAYIK